MTKKRYSKKSGRKYSQVFLQDGSILSKIADAVSCTSEDTVIEIGPGRGALTKYLINKAKQVICVEIDEELIEFLKTKFPHYDNLHIIHADILSLDINSLLGKAGNNNIWLVGNLPYDIGTAIINKFTPYRMNFTAMIFMLQREVVQRILSKPGNKEYGYLSVYIDYFYNCRKIMDVSPRSFKPVPAVHSSVIQMTGKKTGNSLEFDVGLDDLLKASFKHKRKTLINNLMAFDKIDINKQNLKKILEKNNIAPKQRAEELHTEQFISLSEELNRIKE